MCDICLDEDDEDGNEILICELCLVAVHQTCYGSELERKVPDGDWYCARCRALKADSNMQCNEIKCAFCPRIQGIIKPVSKKGKKLWAHPVCVNWLEGIWFSDDKKEKIDG